MRFSVSLYSKNICLHGVGLLLVGGGVGSGGVDFPSCSAGEPFCCKPNGTLAFETAEAWWPLRGPGGPGGLMPSEHGRAPVDTAQTFSAFPRTPVDTMRPPVPQSCHPHPDPVLMLTQEADSF